MCLAPGWPQLRSRLPFGPRSQASFQKAQGPGVCKLPKPPAQGVSGPSSSCVWNPRVVADAARGWQCPFVLCLHPQGCLRRGVRVRTPEHTVGLLLSGFRGHRISCPPPPLLTSWAEGAGCQSSTPWSGSSWFVSRSPAPFSYFPGFCAPWFYNFLTVVFFFFSFFFFFFSLTLYF